MPAPQDDKTRVEAPGQKDSDGDLPRRICRYHVLGRLGAGAQGRVLLGYDADLNRRAAIKLLRGSGGPDERDRMRREAQALALLSHPNAVQVYEVGEYANTLFLAMEYVSGSTLAKWGKEKRTPREVLAAYLQAGRGLAAAHSAGLVHRDFKPHNVMIAKDGRVRVMDFGLARGELATRSPEENTVMRAPTALLWSGVTEAGSLMGTPAYMAPEHWNGDVVDARTDQFAFCVSMWEALYGERPFAGKTTEDFRTAILGNQRRPPPADARVPSWLRQIVERGMQPDPVQRWPSMAALLLALESGIPRRRRRIAAVAGLAIAAALAATAVYERWQAQWRADACWTRGQELVTKWAEARAGIEAAFVAGVPDVGAPTFARMAPFVDLAAADWADAKSRLCMLPDIDKRWSPDLVARADECLLSTRWGFESTLELLAGGDNNIVRQGVAIAADLPPAAPCLDLPHLARQPPPPPEDVRAEVMRVRQALRQTRNLGAIGRYQEGIEESRKLIAEADAIGWKPLAAQVRTTASKFAGDIGDVKSAETWLEEAMVLATESGQDSLLADILTSITDIVGVRLARHEDGVRWGKLARAMMVAQGEGETLRGNWTLNVLALLHLDRGELDQAEQLLQQILAVNLALGGSDQLDVAGTYLNLGNVYSRRERFDDARLAYQRALAGFERIVGPDHPDVALALGNLSYVLNSKGELDEAERLGLRALAIRERTAGPEGLDTARAQQDLGAVYLKRGQTAKALELLERAAITTAKSLGAEHPEVGRALLSLGDLHLQRRDLDKAQKFYLRALGIAEAAHGRDHYDTAWSQLGLGEIALARGRAAEAVRRLGRAQQLFAANERPRDAAYTRFELAQAHWLTKQTRAQARALAQQAAEELSALGATDARGEVDVWLAAHRR